MSRTKIYPDFIEKTCELCQSIYKVRHSKRNKQRFCSKKCSTNSPITKEKNISGVSKTFNEKYGCHPMKTELGMSNHKKSMLEKYGVDSYSKLPEFKTKVLTTRQNHINLNEEALKKFKETSLLRYGKENYSQTDEYKDRIKITHLEKYGVGHSSKSDEFKKKHYERMYNKFLRGEDFSNFTPMFPSEEYVGINKKYEFKCNRCNGISLYRIVNGLLPRCIVCDKSNVSLKQQEIFDFLKEILDKNEVVVVNDRALLYPQEIDIYIPTKKLAIEFDSLYWHCETSGNKNRFYHLNKTIKCIQKEVDCIHIFENEWDEKKEIVKSILRNRLGVVLKSVGARECIIKEIPSIESNKFLNENHLQGEDRSPIRLGLFYNNDLISVMTFCKSRFDAKFEYEMGRFCNKINTSVTGGASKLFKYFLKTYKPNDVISYSDRKIFSGNTYLKLGFTFINNTPPNYHYTTNSRNGLINRMQFQKHKLSKLLENFDISISEWENMKNNGYDRIWDCGNSKWVYHNKLN